MFFCLVFGGGVWLKPTLAPLFERRTLLQEYTGLRAVFDVLVFGVWGVLGCLDWRG